jgi:DNA-binding response OmpR family regulator
MAESISATPACAAGTALLICDDAATIQKLTDSVKELAIAVEVCVEPSAALRIVTHRKFEAVLIDSQLGDASRTILEQIRQSPSNRSAVTLTITDGEVERALAFKAGTSFVIERPLTPSSITRTLKAAYGLIVRERRRYFRCQVEIPATLRTEGNKELHCATANVSEGGVALNTNIRLRVGMQGTLSFTLPGMRNQLTLESKICWSGKDGLCGAQFLDISSQQAPGLQKWLSAKMDENLPSALAEKFHNAT